MNHKQQSSLGFTQSCVCLRGIQVMNRLNSLGLFLFVLGWELRVGQEGQKPYPMARALD
jgi:hypothetical protein